MEEAIIFDAFGKRPKNRRMDHRATDDVTSTLKSQGFGGVRPQELPGAFTLNGALPATPEALVALTEAWQMRGEERTGDS